MRRITLGLITFYQRILSPYMPGTCRHAPTCSEYAREAIERYGALRGIWMGIRRLSRCRPLGTKGYDPVPMDK
jgi:putative membrane protein insertion efficiency factor